MRGELRPASDKRVGMLRSNGLKLSDRELVKHLREADADAAEALVDTCGARAYRLAVRITGSEADAGEVAQDALWSVVRRVEMFRGDSVPTIARATTTRKRVQTSSKEPGERDAQRLVRAESPVTRYPSQCVGRRKRGISVDKLARPKKIAFVALAALAIVLAVNAPSQARGMSGHGAGGHHFDGHHGFEGHHFHGHHFGGVHGGFGFAPLVPYYGYNPYYGYYEAPSYWYYCRSYGAYYPNVTSCPEPWVTVPAS